MKTKIKRFVHFCLVVVILSLSGCAFGLEKSEIFSNEDVVKAFNAHIVGAGMVYTVVPRGVVVSFSSSIFFENGKDVLIESSKSLLDEIGATINLLNMECVIEGNIQNAEYDKNLYYSNIEYSTVLADKIMNYLINNSSVNSLKIKSIGFGQISPFFHSENQNQMKNRIDFVILNYEE
jgi:flagellar motor protein MotB